MSGIFKYISRFPKTIVVAVLLLSLYFMFVMKEGLFNQDGQLILNTTLEPIISRESGAFDFYQRVQKQFGKSDLIVIAFKRTGNAKFDVAFFEEYNRLAKEIQKEVPGIQEVITLTSIPNLDELLNFFSPCQGKSYFHAPVSNSLRAACTSLFKPSYTPQERRALDQRIEKILTATSQNPFAQKDLISIDKSTVAQIIFFKNSSNPSDSTVQKPLARLINNFRLKQYRVGFAGLSRVQYEASRTIKKDLAYILPLSLFLMVIVLALSFRSIRGVLIPFAVILTGILWTAGIFAFMGNELNLMTIVLPPLLVSVGSAYVIHLLHQYYHEAPKGGAIIARTVSSLTTPLVVTALTTIAGFAAITISPIPAIQEMGLFACIGIGIIIFLSLTLAPALLSFLPPPKPPRKDTKPSLLDTILDRLATWTTKYSKRFIAFWIVLGLVAFAGIFRLSVDSNPKNFDEESPIGSDMKLIQDGLAGTTMLTVIFTPKDMTPLLSMKTLRGLHALREWMLHTQEKIKTIKGIRIDKIYSPMDLLDIYTKFRGIPFEKVKGSEIAFLTEKLGSLQGPKYVSDNGKLLQMLVRMKVDSSAAFLQLRELIREKSAIMMPHMDVEFTGVSVLTSESADSITKGQIKSLLLALGTIFIILSLLFFSPKMGLIALYPNIVSIAVFFGLLGWTGIPLGVTVSVIASIALGIGVDSTIHFLNHFNETVKETRCEREASSSSLRHVGKPMIYTTFTLAIGFGMFTISEMDSQVLFGGLTAFTLVVCLITALNFLPSIMVETKLITVWDYLALDYDLEFIRSIDIFRNMSLRETKLAILLAYTIDLGEGDILFRRKDEGKELYVVLAGAMKIFVDNGNENITGTINTLGRGESFGEMALFRKTLRSASAIATADTQLLVINEEVLLRLKRRYPVIATKLFINLAAKLWESITSTNPTIVDIISGMGDSTATQELRLEKVIEKVKAEGRISYTGKANLEEVLKRVASRREDISEVLAMTSEGHIQVEKPVHNLVFSRFTDAQKAWMQKRFECRMVKHGEVVFEAGHGSDWYAIVLSGKFIVTLNRESRKTVIATVHPGELIGEAALLHENGVHSATVTAVEDSEVLVLNREETLAMARKNPRLAARFAFNLVSLLSDRLEHMIATIHH